MAQTPKFSNKLMRLLASDWQISPIIRIKSSQFVTVTSGVDAAVNGEGSQRPNLVDPNGIYPANQSAAAWLNKAAFATPRWPDRQSRHLQHQRAGMFQLDMALTRIFTIPKRRRCRFAPIRLTCPDRVNLSTRFSALNSAAFGQIQSDISGTNGLWQATRALSSLL